ncbi:uncharacterized protein LOC141586893 [Silene latifolia]|uniref:uncharacterized protein LOC141586893 n=1 Tax=Silene latifolia TaxID=37657 RepID=UPI003D76C4E8
MPLCQSQIKDEVFWPYTRDGEYSVKSGYGLIFQKFFHKKGSAKDKKRVSEMGKNFCKSRLWNLPGPNNWKILVWKIITGTLPVGKEFEKRRIGENFECKLCSHSQDHVETAQHVFRDCSVSARVWAGSDLGIRTEGSEMVDIGEWIINWVRYLDKLQEGEQRVLRFLATLWGLWTLQNKMVFEGSLLPEQVLFQSIAMSIDNSLSGFRLQAKRNTNRQFPTDLQEEVLSQYNLAIKNGHPVLIIGNYHLCRTTRVKVDASWDKNFNAAIGWVGYDSNGMVVTKEGRKMRAESPLQAEALGILEVLKWAEGRAILHLEVASDCLQLITQIAGLERASHSIKGILRDCNKYYASFHCLGFYYIPRHLNTVAHDVARHAMRL